MNRHFIFVGLTSFAACAPTVTSADESSLEHWLTTMDYAPSTLATDSHGANACNGLYLFERVVGYCFGRSEKLFGSFSFCRSPTSTLCNGRSRTPDDD